MADIGIGGYQAVGSIFDRYISYSQARSMQNDMNEYNNPQSQVARMRSAGLSPWNFNGEGNQAAQPVLSDSGLGNALGSIADRSIVKRQADAQIDLAKSQAEQTRSQTRTIDTLLKYLDESEQVRLENQRADTRVKNVTEASEAKKVSRYDEQVDQDIKLKKATEAYYYAQTDNCKASTNRINRLLSWEIKESKQRISLSKQQVAVLKTQGKLNDKQCANLGVLMNKSRAEIKKIGVETWAQQHSNEIWQKVGVKPGTPAWTAVVDVLGSVINQFGPE